jgi:DnaJ-class molecular chaperone
MSSEASVSNPDLHISNSRPCHYCEGRGYIAIRDCSGEIQREENCSFCEGTGYIPKITEIFPATKSR